MRESFVFHKDYIEDLPDQYKTEFMQATINYGLYGENPPFKDGTLEMALWAKIARRIDAEAEKYKAISEKRKEAAQKRYQQYQQRTKPAREEPAREEPAQEIQPEKPKRKNFVKPTVEEIAAFCKEKNYNVNAQQFFNYYESNGWKIGRNAMKSWQAAVQNWNTRDKANNKAAGTMWANNSSDADTVSYVDLF